MSSISRCLRLWADLSGAALLIPTTLTTALINHFRRVKATKLPAGRLVLFVLEPESKQSVALRRAIEGFRQMAERPISVSTFDSDSETDDQHPEVDEVTRA